jgi:hypothetical protein
MIVSPPFLIEPRHGLGNARRADLPKHLALVGVGFSPGNDGLRIDAALAGGSELVEGWLARIAVPASRIDSPEAIEE